MRSKRFDWRADVDLYRAQLDDFLDHQPELFQLAQKINGAGVEEVFGRFYKPVGWPAKATRQFGQ